MFDFTYIFAALALVVAFGCGCAFPKYLEANDITLEYVKYLVEEAWYQFPWSASNRLRRASSSATKSVAVWVALVASTLSAVLYAAYRYYGTRMINILGKMFGIRKATGHGASGTGYNGLMPEGRPMRVWGQPSAPMPNFDDDRSETAGSEDDSDSGSASSFNPNDIPISAPRQMGSRFERSVSPPSPPVLSPPRRRGSRFGGLTHVRPFDDGSQDGDQQEWRRGSSEYSVSDYSEPKFQHSNHRAAPVNAPVSAGPCQHASVPERLCLQHRAEVSLCSTAVFERGPCSRAQELNTQLNTTQALHNLQQSMMFGMERLHAENVRREEEQHRELLAMQRILAEREAQAKRDNDGLVLSTCQAFATVNVAKYGPGPVSFTDIWQRPIKMAQDRERRDQEACLDVDMELGAPPPAFEEVTAEWEAHDRVQRPHLWAQAVQHVASIDAHLAMMEQAQRAAMQGMQQPVHQPAFQPAFQPVYQPAVQPESEHMIGEFEGSAPTDLLIPVGTSLAGPRRQESALPFAIVADTAGVVESGMDFD